MRKIKVGFCSRAPARCNWFCGLDGSDRASGPILSPCNAGSVVVLGMITPGGGLYRSMTSPIPPRQSWELASQSMPKGISRLP